MQVRHIPTFAEIVRTVRSGFRTDIGCPFGERRWVGLENEYLMVNADGSPVRREVLDHLWQALISQGWEALTDELSDRVVAVKRNRDDLANLKSHHYDLITTDLGYSTLEIDLAPAPSIPVAQKYLSKLIGAVTSILSKHDTFLLGYGVQPVVSPGPTYIGQKSRYALMLDICQQENGLTTEERGVDLHTVDAACQTQVEVSATEAIPAVNALSATSGLRVALLANSPVWQNQIADYKAIRLMFVRWSWPSRKQQLGMPPRFQDIEHYLDYIFDFRSLMVKRNQRLYKINNNFAFRRFLTDELGQMGVSLDGRETRLFGEIEDVKTQSGFAWFNTRLQLAYGTVEDRVSCQQPPHAHLCASALTLGLVENYRECVKLADTLSLDQWRDIHFLACRHGLDFSYPGVDINALIEQMLAIAERGLRMRGYGEEVYLATLYKRLSTGLCPADEVRQQFFEGGIANIVANNDMRKWL